MPISFAAAPNDAKSVAMQGLQDISRASAVGGALGAGPPPQMMDGYPVYDLGLEDLANDKGLPWARATSWRFQLIQGQVVLYAVEVIGPPAGGSGSRLGSLTTGHTKEFITALDQAEKLPEVVNGKYELRLLRVPALYVTALWLKDLQKDEDVFLVLPPTFPPFLPQHVYHESDVLPLLHAAAKQKLAQEQKLQRRTP